MSEESTNANVTNITAVATNELAAPDVSADQSTFHAQAAITFELVNTNLVALYKKDGNNNTFLVIPTDKEPSGGMTIADMIDDINSFLKRFSSEFVEIDAGAVTDAVKEVKNASTRTSTQPPQQDSPDYQSIKVELRQAFLYLSTEKSVEYGFELDVDVRGLFPSEMSLFNVKKLSLSIWNTERKKILERMNIITVDTYLQ
ncbi:MAG: hypothetical protein K2J99_02195 [Lachnospiraceae bacterium]|nr:hypothetical protein [Lachnospiraceae bacterium]